MLDDPDEAVSVTLSALMLVCIQWERLKPFGNTLLGEPEAVGWPLKQREAR